MIQRWFYLLVLFITLTHSFLFSPVSKSFVLDRFRDSVSSQLHGEGKSITASFSWMRKITHGLVLIPLLFTNVGISVRDDELAEYAAEGNKVGVDGSCFLRKCALETVDCANDPSCLKGLSCLARCKGGSMCSTACFAKYGSKNLDNLLHCSVEKNDCVQVPGKEVMGWRSDTIQDLPSKPLSQFEMASLKGSWYKVMGLDSRYDCFDCQQNTFDLKDAQTLTMEASFRIPRPSSPGYLQTKINEELHPVPTSKSTSPSTTTISPHLRSKGEMFGLTFWENWYILAETPSLSTKSTNSWNQFGIQLASAASRKSDESSRVPELKLIYYTGHTLQGSYKGAFLYSRSKEMTPGLINAARELIASAGLNPNDFCMIRNQCFLSPEEGDVRVAKSPASPSSSSSMISRAIDNPSLITSSDDDNTLVKELMGNLKLKFPFWYLGQKFFYVTTSLAKELADWMEDPALVSDWLVNQQERMVFTQPLEVSPFAALGDR